MTHKTSLAACLLLAALAACVAEDATVMAGAPMPDLLETTAIPEAMKAYWRQVSRSMWNWLLTNDHDFHDSEGNIVPPLSPHVAYAASGPASTKCGRFSRNWIRLGFHDCGTYSKFLRRYGCNGSIRKELPHTEPWFDYTTINADGKSFKLLGNDVFDQFKVNGVMDPAVDFEFNSLHQENAGLAASIAALYQAKLYANSPAVGLWDASFADILALGSLLAMARCDGPQVKFVPGRPDAMVADQDDNLPNFADNFHHTLFYFLGNGMSELDGITLIGGSHSAACFMAGCMDNTPNKLDNQWAKELLAWDGATPPVCAGPHVPGAARATPDRCKAPSDILWLQHPQSKAYVELFVSPATTFDALQRQVNQLLEKQGVINYKGLIQSANLCATTDRTCPGYAENFAFHTLIATSMFRLLQLIPSNL